MNSAPLARLLFIPLAFVSVGSSLISSVHAAPVVSIESSQVRVELSASPFCFTVIERVTGEAILQERQISVRKDHDTWQPVASFEKLASDARAITGIGHLDDGSIVNLQISLTDDPSIVRVRVAALAGKAIEHRFIDQGEHVYGIWEAPFGGPIDNRGADHDFYGLQRELDHIADFVSGRAPFYFTTRKYGIYVDSEAFGHFRIAIGGATSFSFNEGALDYYVIYGQTPAAILSRHNRLAGPARIPPLWGLGPTFWRDDHHRGWGPARVSSAQALVINDADQLQKLKIPATAYWIDRPFGTGTEGWGNGDFDQSFPDPRKMVSDLTARGLNLMIWIANKCWDPNAMYREALANGWLFKNVSGSSANILDPNAYRWLGEKLAPYVDLGIKGFKIDRGEEDEDQIPHEVGNRLTSEMARLADETLASRIGDDHFVFARNLLGRSRGYAALWNGDSLCTFAGLRGSMQAGLRAGAINFPTWGSDAGGYQCKAPTKEVFARWMQFTALSTMMNVYIDQDRTPWFDYDAELVEILRQSAVLHDDLRPYIRAALQEAFETGMPVMRTLAMAAPNDADMSDADMSTTWDEYLFGRDILVAPVTVDGARARGVYFPRGKWVDLDHHDRVYVGPASFTVSAPIGRIPLFAREGAILPRGSIIAGNDRWSHPQESWKPSLRVELYPSARVSSEQRVFSAERSSRARVTPLQGGDLRIAIGDVGIPVEVVAYLKGFASIARADGTAMVSGRDYRFDSKNGELKLEAKGPTELIIRKATTLF